MVGSSVCFSGREPYDETGLIVSHDRKASVPGGDRISGSRWHEMSKNAFPGEPKTLRTCERLRSACQRSCTILPLEI